MSSTAAKRYAKALYTLCTEQQAVEQVHRDLESLAELLDRSPEWKAFVCTPHGALEKRAALLAKVMDGRVHPLTARFLAFIDRRRRIVLLPGVIAAWQDLHDEARGILRARVVSAGDLTAGQQEILLQRLGKRYGKQVIATHGTDPALIGGLKVFIGDQVFDYSIEGLLQTLHKQMIHA